MSKLRFTPLAEADLQGILDYISIDRPETARRIVEEIHARCELLANKSTRRGALTRSFSSSSLFDRKAMGHLLPRYR
jgi:plasmid stabilization system protein ParE